MADHRNSRTKVTPAPRRVGRVASAEDEAGWTAEEAAHYLGLSDVQRLYDMKARHGWPTGYKAGGKLLFRPETVRRQVAAAEQLEEDRCMRGEPGRGVTTLADIRAQIGEVA